MTGLPLFTGIVTHPVGVHTSQAATRLKCAYTRHQLQDCLSEALPETAMGKTGMAKLGPLGVGAAAIH